VDKGVGNFKKSRKCLLYKRGETKRVGFVTLLARGLLPGFVELNIGPKSIEEIVPSYIMPIDHRRRSAR